MKYESWILARKEIVPSDGGFAFINDEGKELRSIEYVYECPYCHKEYHCKLTNNLNFRKCRYCNQRVSPYKGEVIESAWMFDNEVDEFNQKEAAR